MPPLVVVSSIGVPPPFRLPSTRRGVALPWVPSSGLSTSTRPLVQLRPEVRLRIRRQHSVDPAVGRERTSMRSTPSSRHRRDIAVRRSALDATGEVAGRDAAVRGRREHPATEAADIDQSVGRSHPDDRGVRRADVVADLDETPIRMPSIRSVSQARHGRASRPRGSRLRQQVPRGCLVGAFTVRSARTSTASPSAADCDWAVGVTIWTSPPGVSG